jgi:hypothetical protein
MVGHLDRPVTQPALRPLVALLAGRPVKASCPHQLRPSIATQKTLGYRDSSLQVPGEMAACARPRARRDETLMPTLGGVECAREDPAWGKHGMD